MLVTLSIASTRPFQTLDEMAKLAFICSLDGSWRALFKRMSGNLGRLRRCQKLAHRRAASHVRDHLQIRNKSADVRAHADATLIALSDQCASFPNRNRRRFHVLPVV